MSYVDAHIHLAGYAGRIEAVVEDAKKNGIAHLLSNATDYASSIDTISLAQRFEGLVIGSVGVHPWTVVNSPSLSLEKFENLFDEHSDRIKVIGEIGLDGKYTQDEEKKKAQRETFQFFLRLAEQKRLPVTVHSRLATDDTFEELSRFNPPRVLLHWYDGPMEDLKLIQDRGYFISIGPSLLTAKRITEIALKADLSIILSETDGPVKYHGPFEGRSTQPSFVIDVVRKLAEIKSMKADDVRDSLWRNFQRFKSP